MISPRVRVPVVLAAVFAVAALALGWWSIGVGVIAGLVGAMIAALQLVRYLDPEDGSGRRWGVVLSGLAVSASPAVASWLVVDATAGLTTAVTTTGLVLAVVGPLLVSDWWRRASDRRALAGLDAALAGGGDPAGALGELRPALGMPAAARLAEHGRFHEALAQIERVEPSAATVWLLDEWRVTLLLAVGEVAGARAVVAAMPAAITDAQSTLVALLDLRVAIAEGRAAEVVDRVGERPAEERGEDHHVAWQMTLADAHAALGRPAVARELLLELRATAGDEALRVLCRFRRPSAATAAELLAGGASAGRG